MTSGGGPLFLGLDLSTQALKATLIDINVQGLDEIYIPFDENFPQFHTKGGVLPAGDSRLAQPDQAAAPIEMYILAIDMLWETIVHVKKWPVSRIVSISCAGQQHASVYLSEEACSRLSKVQPDKSLHLQLDHGFFSRVIVPNWQDATTLEECEELMQYATAKWGAAYVPALCRKTGSIAHTRFTGAQILRWRKKDPEQYDETASILLVSNFLTTLLGAGSARRVAPLDKSDACGMNLWNINSEKPHWSIPLLRFVSKQDRLDKNRKIVPGTEALGGYAKLERMLGRVQSDPAEALGYVGNWLQKRYGLNEHCLISQGTGDNPATLQCLTPQFGEAVISLGTSDTILLPSNEYTPSAQYHVFSHPVHCPQDTQTPRYFLMFVYKNGSLSREWVRDTYCNSNWDEFNAAIDDGVAKHPDRQGVGFYWLRPEILPWEARGVHRYECRDKKWEQVQEFESARYNARAIVQSQFMDFRGRIAQVLSATQNKNLSRVYVVGGAAKNQTLCQLLANVLGCEVARPVVVGRSTETNERVPYNIGSVGAAYRARWTWECAKTKSRPSFNDVIAKARANGGADAPYEIVARPDPQRVQAYSEFVPQWEELEIGAAQASSMACTPWG
ncbi:xylulokinase [Malassezia yamatoensis]|uniref:Xylulose kinase n=1 Tax=Malassezia yamatoensis TaxID=253288 RepID=A0AAJ6CJW5_9BASI|nr:xylulokinase [Malassezia yamatoensis]